MDFIRNLFTLFQRLQEIVRDGQRRSDLPGMVMALVREMFGGKDDSNGEGDGPTVYQGKRAHADQATPEAASRATARNRASRDADLPEPAVYRTPAGSASELDFEPARAPARNADDRSEAFPEPARAAALTREEYDYQPATATPAETAQEPAFEPAIAEPAPEPTPQPAPEPAPQAEPTAISWDDEVSIDTASDAEHQAAPAEPAAASAEPETQPAEPASAEAASPTPKNEKDDDWLDLDDWQGTALKVAGLGAAAAGTAAGAMAIKNRFFGDDEDEKEAAASEQPAIPLGQGDEAGTISGNETDSDDSGDIGWAGTAAMAAPAAATVLPTSGDDAEPPAQSSPAAPARRPHPVEVIPADPRNPATQPASQTLANPGIRLYGTMDAAMYAEFTERLAEQAPGGPIVVALTTMEGDPEIARSMADDIRLLRDRARREIIFLGKTAVYGAGVLFMAAFPVSHRYLTRATKLMVTENKRAQPLELAGGSLRSVATQLEHAQREIQREIEQEDEDYRAISDGSNVSVQELREKAPNDWYITASEAKAMGLIAEVV